MDGGSGGGDEDDNVGDDDNDAAGGGDDDDANGGGDDDGNGDDDNGGGGSSGGDATGDDPAATPVAQTGVRWDDDETALPEGVMDYASYLLRNHFRGKLGYFDRTPVSSSSAGRSRTPLPVTAAFVDNLLTKRLAF